MEGSSSTAASSTARACPEEPAPAAAATPPPIRACSWNVLAESLLRGNSELYRGCDPVGFERRMERVVQGVLTLSPDIVALQEVERFESDFERPLSAAGYAGLYKKRTGGQMDGVALFWKTARFELRASEIIEYACHLSAGLPPAEAEKMRKHNVGIVATLTDLASGRALVVGTSHILWNPKRGLVKLRQMQYLIARADEARARAAEEGAAVVLLGDFNCTPSSALYGFLLGGSLRGAVADEGAWDGQKCQQQQQKWVRSPQQMQKLRWEQAQQPLKFVQHRQLASSSTSPPPPPGALPESHRLAGLLSSAYGSTGEPECSSYHSGFQGTVDYILHTRELGVVQLLPTPSRAQLAGRRSLPDAFCPSDHIAIAADLGWTPGMRAPI